MVRSMALVSLLTLVSLTFASSIVAAQTGSAIAGTVKDATGGVLPGVMVEAASPALIEKVRTAVTDGQGLYNITDLRSGVYTVSFTLSGFNAVRRERIELSAAFTATVNAELHVGALEETITVSGNTPTVDIQNVVQRRVVTRDIMDAIPTGNRSWAALAILVPGAKVGSNVGGTLSAQASATIHGGRSQESMMLLDGQRYNQGIGTGGGRNAFNENDGSVEEISFETGALSAESEVGGFVHNIIPKEGANIFKGFFATNYTNHEFQSDNLSDEQRASGGAVTADSIEKIWDVNPAFGGPIARDTLWFYTAFRHWGYHRGVAGAFFNQTPTGLSYTPDLSRPGVDYLRKIASNLRLTWRVTEKSKLAVFYENQIEDGPYWYSNRLHAPEATWIKNQQPNYVAQARWSFPATSRLLLDAGSTFVNNDWHTTPQPNVPRELPAIRELRTGVVWRNYPGTFGHNGSHQYNFTGSLSYVTGSHTLKVGGLLLRSDDLTTWNVTGNATNWQFLDGRPNSVVVFATPLQLSEELNAQVGLYAQDQWRINRLTFNLGVRFDYYNASVPAQRQGPGPWVPTRDITFAEVKDVPNWKDVLPRFGVAYDLFGTGKTAFKATLAKYVFGSEIVTYTRLANPPGAITTSATRTWNDANGDFAPQESELGPVNVRDFGSPRITQRFDPDINNGFGKRGHNWEVSTAIQHELLPGLGVSAAYFHRWWRNLTVTQNQGVAAADFDQYCITAPVDPRLPGGGGNGICGIYDVKPTKFGVFDNVITFADNFGEQRDIYDGVDLTMNARFPNGATVAGGTNTERTKSNVCYSANDPSLTPSTLTSVTLLTGRSLTDCDIRLPWQTQFKFYGAYPLPWWGIQLSAAFQRQPGPQITASYTARNAEILPSLGRDLSSGPNGTATVQLIPPGTLYGDTLTQVDFRVTKSFQIGPARVQGMFDLYNMFNANPVLAYNTSFGSAWLRPTNILIGRLAKFGMQVNF